MQVVELEGLGVVHYKGLVEKGSMVAVAEASTTEEMEANSEAVADAATELVLIME